MINSSAIATQDCSLFYVFFFSSRRRHTRLQGDWSSDVCSSDLADALKGPIICAPVGIAPAVAQRRFPLTVRPGQSRALRYDLTFTCGANPDRKPDWAFSVTVDHVALDGNADENPTNDTCPRAPTASDRGCGVAGPGHTR